MPVEEIKLTASFKIDLADADEAAISEIHHLFAEYRKIVNELIEYSHSHGVTSPRRLWYAKYHEMRQKAQNAKLTFLPPLSPQYLKSFLRAC